MEEQYIVWVDNLGVNDFYLQREQAIGLAKEYVDDGYENVIIENIIDGSWEQIS